MVQWHVNKKWNYLQSKAVATCMLTHKTSKQCCCVILARLATVTFWAADTAGASHRITVVLTLIARLTVFSLASDWSSAFVSATASPALGAAELIGCSLTLLMSGTGRILDHGNFGGSGGLWSCMIWCAWVIHKSSEQVSRASVQHYLRARETSEQRSREVWLHLKRENIQTRTHITRDAADAALASDGVGAVYALSTGLAEICVLCGWRGTFVSTIASQALGAAVLFVLDTLRVSAARTIQRPGRRIAWTKHWNTIFDEQSLHTDARIPTGAFVASLAVVVRTFHAQRWLIASTPRFATFDFFRTFDLFRTHYTVIESELSVYDALYMW